MLLNDCNLACTYCVYGELFSKGRRKASPQYMTSEVAKKAIDLLMSNAADSEKYFVGFYGGEPLLNFKLVKFVVEYLNARNTNNKNTYLHMTTNGTLLKSETIKWLSENNIRDCFKVS